MKQTILGANGTIGKILAKELATYTRQIRLVSRHPKKVNDTDELFPADLSIPEQVDKAIEGSEVVYLVVGFDYNIKVWRENWPKLIKATIDACIKHKSKLVFFDNVYLYDIKSIGHMTEDSPINPPSKKGVVRKEIAEMILNQVKAGDLTALIARAPDFYGPDNEKSFLIETVYKNILKGKNPNWFINANKKHSFIYTPDAAKATAILGNTPEAYNQVWHLPTDKNNLTGKEWVALFNKEMNTSKKIVTLPMFMLKILGIFMPFMREMPEMMYQYDRDYFFDSSKFNKRFNFTPTTNEMGVKQIVNQAKTANGK
ncbi:MAG: NAD-dependent epimerase/dehydratase family protein [Chitinophagaceae bacterium]|nr:NAD-dependent epimerase/dehydratase family protein [Chitinophagaceae bacterium]MDP1811054.1 NAD-dependent epimerase/dehydratase family protein [Sediminibacterium sp.]MDP3128250.1 NAD-dependent epimerase/dehydratase family protein [Sediminibacterium sp.]